MHENLFRLKKPDYERLQSFGFSKADGFYHYHTEIANGQFLLTVSIADGGRVETKVIDRDGGDEYLLYRAPTASGALVGLIRAEIEATLERIAGDCFEPDVFKSDCAKELIAHVRRTYGDEPEFLWQKLPTNAVFRRKDTGKWYAALLTVSKRKLGIDSDETAEIIDLRIRPEELSLLPLGEKYFPGYHMNKRSWYTLLLDGSVPQNELYRRLDESYLLAVK